MITQSQYIKLLEETHRAQSSLYRDTKISLNAFGGVCVSCMRDQVATMTSYLRDEKNPFFSVPDQRDLVILRLAITQEEQNDYISQDQIDAANKFFTFNKKITFEEIQEYNSKFI